MKSLIEIYDDPTIVDMHGQKSDKGTIHSYINVYNDILKPYQSVTENFLEIGVACGASIPLWNAYFENAQIIEVDSNADKSCSADIVEEFAKKFDRVKLLTNTDAYTMESVFNLFKMTNNEGFEVIIEDGSHWPIHQAFVVIEYGKILRPGGILIIEDVSSAEVLTYLSKMPISYKAEFRVADLRTQKNRPDDLMFIVRRLDG